MEAGTLFRLKGIKDDIFKVVENPENTCNKCCAVGKERLCSKMPYCHKLNICFTKLSPYEVRKAKKEKQFIDYFES